MMRLSVNQLRKLILETILVLEAKSDKGKCPPSGCIKKVGDKWKIISNKDGHLWPQDYKTKKSAEAALRGYHASKK